MTRNGLLVGSVIGGCVILAAVAFALVSALLRNAEDIGAETAIVRLEREVAEKEGELRLLRGEVEALRVEMSALRAGGGVSPPAPQPDRTAPEATLDQFGGAAPPQETEDLIDRMRLAASRFNHGVGRARPTLLRELLGEPRESYSDNCLPVTNPRLVAALETRSIAGVPVTMLRPALDSLQEIFDRLRREEPEIYAALGSAGALCARYVRGADGTVSNHAWGAAVDLTLKGDLDAHGDATTQFGLVVLAEFFNEAGWFWGAAFGREDSMHFEVGEDLLRTWAAEGRL